MTAALAGRADEPFFSGEQAGAGSHTVSRKRTGPYHADEQPARGGWAYDWRIFGEQDE